VYWLPEIHRLIAEVGPASSREDTLRMALDLARSHGSRSLALRAAISLVRHTASAAGELRNELQRVREGERSAEATEAMALLDLPSTV
jgi:hypothetical protein